MDKEIKIKLAEKLLDRELDRLAPVLAEKALARREDARIARRRSLAPSKMTTYALAGGACLAALGIAGNILESRRMRRAVRRELKRALEPVEKELHELRKENEALRKEVQALKK